MKHEALADPRQEYDAALIELVEAERAVNKARSRFRAAQRGYSSIKVWPGSIVQIYDENNQPAGKAVYAGIYDAADPDSPVQDIRPDLRMIAANGTVTKTRLTLRPGDDFEQIPA